MFGKYTSGGIEGISVDRTEKAVNLVKEAGGEVKSIHALLGEYDLIFIVDLPGMKEAIKTSVGLIKLTGASFVTHEALPAGEFDKLVAG